MTVILVGANCYENAQTPSASIVVEFTYLVGTAHWRMARLHRRPVGTLPILI